MEEVVGSTWRRGGNKGRGGEERDVRCARCRYGCLRVMIMIMNGAGADDDDVYVRIWEGSIMMALSYPEEDRAGREPRRRTGPVDAG